MNVLVVDNDEDYRSVLRDLLFLYGHDVSVASGGQEALKALSSKEFDVVLSDISMPGMDGLTLHDMIRGNPASRKIPFVYISGYPNLRGSAPIEDAGKDFVLAKMTPIQELLELLNDLSGHGDAVPVMRKDRCRPC